MNLPQHGFQRFLAIRCVLGTLTSAQSRLRTFTFSQKQKRVFLGLFFQDEKSHDSSLELYSSFARTSLTLDKETQNKNFTAK